MALPFRSGRQVAVAFGAGWRAKLRLRRRLSGPSCAFGAGTRGQAAPWAQARGAMLRLRRRLYGSVRFAARYGTLRGPRPRHIPRPSEHAVDHAGLQITEGPSVDRSTEGRSVKPSESETATPNTQSVEEFIAEVVRVRRYYFWNKIEFPSGVHRGKNPGLRKFFSRNCRV